MKHALLFVMALALPAIGQDDAARKERFERFRKLTPDQKRELRERVDRIRKLPTDERDRLRENCAKLRDLGPEDRARLRERMDKLNPRDRRELGDVAGGFFRWAKAQGFQEGFPRDQFFAWLKTAKREDLDRLRALEPMDRRDAFVKLFYEFKDSTLQRIVSENEKRPFCEPAEIQALRDASIREFWPKAGEIQRRRFGKGHDRRPGPQRPHGPRPTQAPK